MNDQLSDASNELKIRTKKVTSGNGQSYCGAEQYNAANAYPTAGTKVFYSCKIWKNKWYANPENYRSQYGMGRNKYLYRRSQFVNPVVRLRIVAHRNMILQKPIQRQEQRFFMPAKSGKTNGMQIREKHREVTLSGKW